MSKKNTGKKFSLGFIVRHFWVLTVFAAITLAGAWIFQISRLADLSESISCVQQKMSELREENAALAARVGFVELPEPELIAENFNFERIKDVGYIRASEPAVFAR